MRQKANLLINEIVQLFLETYPDLRYIQALWTLNIIDINTEGGVADRFYEEPVDTLKRCEERIRKFLSECPQTFKSLEILVRVTEICNS